MPWTLSELPVLPGNPFGIPAYKPTILWLYNGRSKSWVDAIADPTVRQLVTRPPATGELPWLRTVFQNPSPIPYVDEVLMYTPAQVNLLANMCRGSCATKWCKTPSGVPVPEGQSHRVSEPVAAVIVARGTGGPPFACLTNKEWCPIHCRERDFGFCARSKGWARDALRPHGL